MADPHAQVNPFGRLEPVPAADHPQLVAEVVVAALPFVPTCLVAPIDPSFADTEALCAEYRLALEASVNAVVVKGVRAGVEKFVVCMTPAHKRVDVNNLVRRRLDARKASFAPMDEAVALTGMECGGITPVGAPAGWPIWVDDDVLAIEWACIGSGIRGSKLFLPGRALLDLPHAELVPGLAR